MAKKEDNALVVIDSDVTEYSLLEGPDKNSKYVVEAKEKLIQRLQINELAADLSNVGKFLLMAHCGVMGHLQLEIQVRKRLQSVVKLCNDTVFTLNEFDRASDSAISNMASAYQYLMEGFEDIALDTLKEVGETSKNMAVESSMLQQRFGIEANEVERVHEQTLIKRDQFDEANMKTTLTIQKLKQDESLAEKKLNEATSDEQKAMKELEETMKKENEIIEKRREVARDLEKELEQVQKNLDAADDEARIACDQTATGFLAGIGKGLTHLVGNKTDDDVREEKVQISYKNVEHQHKTALLKSKEKKDAEDKAAEIQKKLRELQAKELELSRKNREEALKRMTEVAKKLLESQFEDGIQKEALDCLHHALTTLKSLQSIMRLAEKFWRETYSACNAVTGHGMTKQVARLQQTVDEDIRKRLWNATGLKMDAVKYYAQWVAIQQMCSISRVSLTNSQRQVHMFTRQNPTKEEGKKLLKILVDEITKLHLHSTNQIEEKMILHS